MEIKAMRGLMAKISRMLRAMREAMGRMVMIPIRAADGALTWIWQVIANRNLVDVPETPWERAEAEMEAENETGHPDLDAASAAMSLLGAEARLAAKEMLQFGEVRSETVRPVIRNWVAGLTRQDLEAFVEASDLRVGRHYAGVEEMRNAIGEPILRPRPERDEEMARERRKRKKKFEEATKPKPAPMPEPLGGPAAPLLGLAA